MAGQQVYQEWRPAEGVPGTLFVDGIHDDVEGLRFLLRGEDPASPALRLRYEAVVAYRNINESFRSRTWKTRATVGLSSLMTVRNSLYVAWLIEESTGLLVAEQLTHYAIYTDEDCIDVVTEFPPEVDWPNE